MILSREQEEGVGEADRHPVAVDGDRAVVGAALLARGSVLLLGHVLHVQRVPRPQRVLGQGAPRRRRWAPRRRTGETKVMVWVAVL